MLSTNAASANREIGACSSVRLRLCRSLTNGQSNIDWMFGSVSKRHPDEFLIMLIDGAPSHRSGPLVVPKNMALELNSVERFAREAFGKPGI